MEKILSLVHTRAGVVRGPAIYHHVQKTLNAQGSTVYIQPLDSITYSLLFQGNLTSGKFFMIVGPTFINRDPCTILEPVEPEAPQIKTWTFFNCVHKNSFVFGQCFFEDGTSSNLNIHLIGQDSHYIEIQLDKSAHRVCHFRAIRQWTDPLPRVTFQTPHGPNSSHLNLSLATINTFAIITLSEKAVKELTKWLRSQAKTHQVVHISPGNTLGCVLFSTPLTTYMVNTDIFYDINIAEVSLLTTPKTASSMYLKTEGEIKNVCISDLLLTLHHCTLTNTLLPVFYLYTDGGLAIKTRIISNDKNLPVCFSVLNKSATQLFAEVQATATSTAEQMDTEPYTFSETSRACLKRCSAVATPSCAKKSKQATLQKFLNIVHKQLHPATDE
ncbi:hypothetical protein [Vombatid gammaherpesvirus 1]|uniref:Uncharacterized protein n=1 Tax=Vombatid gammaherpesvirus 1 TaxID=2052651 RepID=A0A3S8D7N1_9GAMA|nr:hypothetical protein KM710_gp53 [Vombatid gammaherpesvirus 1]AZB49158.1 hypothetical protein [Vombatid gammaherpesvirus 1]